jgi:hypothetical protein
MSDVPTSSSAASDRQVVVLGAALFTLFLLVGLALWLTLGGDVMAQMAGTVWSLCF